eukprot:gb/GECH01011435.1/.p1 GENE.gb/GECH01011435.1/~~gb/GECH01011435.1/.p1  ORF type:complete len:124 (+),score=28.50 gb/GECH01011435.1/:1-372(+)
MSKEYSQKEIQKHNESSGEPWVVIHGKVYDVTNFIDDHPGGDEVILETAGEDATEGFENVGHSSDAREQLADLQIGTVHPDDKHNFNQPSEGSDGSGGSNILKYVVTAVIVGAAIYVGLMTKK